MMKKALRPSRTSVLTRATWHNIPEDGILQFYYCLNSFVNVVKSPTGYGKKAETLV
jgi:hypothetical protein